MVARLAWFFILAISNMDYPDTDTLPSYGQGHAALPPVTQQNSNGVTYLGYTIMVGAENVHDSLTGGHSPIMPCRPVVVDSEGDILVLPSLSDVDSSYHMAKAAAAVAADVAYDDQRNDEGDNPMPSRLSDVNLDNQKGKATPAVSNEPNQENWAVGLLPPSLSEVDLECHRARAATYGYSRT